MAKPTWIKLDLNLFDNTKIKMMRKMPLIGEHVIEVWAYLLIRAGKTNDDGLIYLDRNIPMTPEMIALDGGFDETTVKLILEQFEKFNMLNVGDNGVLSIGHWEEHQNVDGLTRIREQNRKRVQRYRERQKNEQKALEYNEELGVTLHETLRNGIEENREEEIRKDKSRKEEMRLEKTTTSNSGGRGSNPSNSEADEIIRQSLKKFGYHATNTLIEGTRTRILQPMIEQGVFEEHLIQMLEMSLRVTELAGKNSINYATGVIKNWLAAGASTPQMVANYQKTRNTSTNNKELSNDEVVDIPEVDIMNTDWSKIGQSL